MSERLGRGALAYVAGQFPLRSETFVYREVRELRRRGWEVACVTLRAPDEALVGGDDLVEGRIEVYGGPPLRGALEAASELARHPARALRTLGRALLDAAWPGEPSRWGERLKTPVQAVAALTLARKLRPRAVRHVHAHFAHAPTAVARYTALQLGVPFSFTGHANDIFERRALLKRKLAAARFVACISEWHRDYYRSIVPSASVRYPIVRCGVDVREFAPPGEHSAQSPPQSPLLCVLSVARLVPKKGIDTLVRSLHRLDPSGASWRLTIAGDGPEAGRLRELTQQLGLSEAITFLGAVDNARVRELLIQHDVFALPCRVDEAGDKDGIPVVLMEAMASGLPVVSGDLEAIRELVRSGESGLLVDGNDDEQLCEALRRLRDDRPFAGRLAAQGRARVVDEFSLEANVDRLEAAILASGEKGSDA